MEDTSALESKYIDCQEVPVNTEEEEQNYIKCVQLERSGFGG